MLPTYTGSQDEFSDQSNQSTLRNGSNPATQRIPISTPSEFLRQYEAHQRQAGTKRTAIENDIQDLSDGLNVRKRISRACDQCNQLRSKCDGRQPCAHCVENELPCAYERAHKKRGRVPKKDQGLEDETRSLEVQNMTDTNPVDDTSIQDSNPSILLKTATQNISLAHEMQPQGRYDASQPGTSYNGYDAVHNTGTDHINHIAEISHGFNPTATTNFASEDSALFTSSGIDMSGYGFPLGDDYSVAFMGRAPIVESPDWLALTTPMLLNEQWTTPPRPPDTVRFPVLQSLLPYLESIIPQSLACDLLEQYFATASSLSFQPKNPYVLSFIFRKQSILHPSDPRPCSAALLASMLWISAQYSDISFLTAQPGARVKTCQKLLELTINMLKPLVHGQATVLPDSSGHSGMQHIDAGLGGLVLPVDIMVGNTISRRQVDNIVTYAHLATVVSASERKAASLRWWNVAWSLARETRLGRELPPEQVTDEETGESIEIAPSSQSQFHNRTTSVTSGSMHDAKTFSRLVSEEEREERRRTWWLLYMMDRHLALCYNRPLFFLNKECELLLEPLDEKKFQLGQFDDEASRNRQPGLDIRCTSMSVFGFFLPLMVILGEILDLNHMRNRPRFGPRAKRPRDFSDTVSEIEEQLGAFGKTLQSVLAGQRFDSDGTDHQDTALRTTQPCSVTKFSLHAEVIAAYGTHIMHVLHILLTGKWDPIALLDDNDLWISSQSFVNATGHAVSAAEALAHVIDYDPDLSFMPYFFGIYLLQGSFLLLLFADKLQNNITPKVVEACETIVRAHEACVSTLDNQYQRNFRRVMRSALQQLRGRLREDGDVTAQQNWRREILKLYRWTGDGTGLAL